MFHCALSMLTPWLRQEQKTREKSASSVNTQNTHKHINIFISLFFFSYFITIVVHTNNTKTNISKTRSSRDKNKQKKMAIKTNFVWKIIVYNYNVCTHLLLTDKERPKPHTRSHMGHEISWMWEDVECVHNILWYILRRGIYPSFIHHTFRRSEEGLLYYYYYSLSSIIWRNRWNYCMFSFLSLSVKVCLFTHSFA